MKKVNFNRLKNLEVPEALIEKALDAPNQKKKKPFLSAHYQKAIGLAATLVIAVGVSIYMLFFTGGNSRLEQAIGVPPETTQSYEQGYSSPVRSDGTTGDKDTSQTSTGGTSGTVNSVTDKQKENNNSTGTPAENKTNKPSDKTAESSAAQESKNQPKTNAAAQTEGAYTTEALAEGTTFPEAPTAFPARCTLSCKIDAELFSGEAYCKLVGEDGTVLGSKELFGSAHRAEAKDNGNGKMILTYYVGDSDVKAAQGKMYFVEFYDGYGAVLKRSAMIMIFEELYFMF